MNLALHPRKSGFGKVRQPWISILIAFQHTKSYQLEQRATGNEAGWVQTFPDDLEECLLIRL
jgi:hypothetical protein